MSKKTLFALWGGLFILCAGLGFIPEPTGAGRVLLSLVSLAFFAPPAMLLFRGGREEAALVRNLSALSLGLTVLTLILNFLCAFRSKFLGDVLHFVLTMVSAPMVASGYWAVSLFLWSCLLIAGMKRSRK